ncbi:MAG: cyclic nucleotide-binding domain-containing protein [Anaerolineaceae bacterium]|jgi:CRP-like cAMP-binding protein
MVNLKETVGFLQRVPLFQGLKPHQKELLAKRFVERDYKKDDKIVTQGKGGEGFFIIIQGHADAFRTLSDGNDVQVNSFGPTNYFGELALLDEEGLRTASVVATEPTKCVVLTRWDFLGLLKEENDMAISILIEMARRFRIMLDTM